MQRYKYATLLLSFLLLIICSCTDKSTNTNFTLEGNLKNLDSPYFFIATELSDSIVVDTVFVDAKGHFSYQGTIDELSTSSLYFSNKSWSISVFVDKGWKVGIKGDVNMPDLVMVNGGNINDDLTSFKKNNIHLFTSKANLLQQMAEATNPDIHQNRDTELKNINFELTNKAKEYIESNPEKIASVVLIQDFYKNNTSIDLLDKELKMLKGDAAKSSLTKELEEYSEKIKMSQVGAMAPDLNLKRGKKEVNLNSFRGKYVLLTFTSREAEMYKTDIPTMIKSYKNLKSKNVEFVSIIIDNAVEDVASDSIKWSVFYDRKGWASDAINNYNITKIPYSILISPDGQILDRGIELLNLSQKIEEFQQEHAIG